MVLRKKIAPSLFILFVGLMLSSSTALAQIRVGSGDKRLFNEAKLAYKNGQYQNVLALLNRRYSLRDSSTPSGALALAGYAYEKLGQWNNAEKIWAFLITQRYRTANSKMTKAYRADAIDEAQEAPLKLYEYYHRRAEALTQLYQNDYKSLSPRLRDLYSKTALMYVAILEESDDYEDDSYDTIPERLEKFDKEVKAKKYRNNWFLQSSYMSWRDRIGIVFSDGSRAEIESTGEGSCFGGGWRYENDYWEFNLNGCYAMASMTIGAEDLGNTTPINNYFQKGVPSTAIMGGPSFLWKPRSKGASFGVHIPFVYRKGDYEPAPTATLEDTQIFTYGYLLQADWRFEKLGISTKFGKVQRFSSSVWSLGLMYTF